MNHTFGYVLCCQSPALFLLAIALVIDFFVRKGRARLRAILALLGAGVCIGLGFVLYYQGMLQEYFEVKNFWRIRAPGWVGLVLAAALLVYVLVKAIARADGGYRLALEGGGESAQVFRRVYVVEVFIARLYHERSVRIGVQRYPIITISEKNRIFVSYNIRGRL